jgi:O-antigen ligase
LIKLAFYLGLAALGVVAALLSPVAGAIGAVEAYLLNPSAIEMSGNTIPFQMIMTVAFIAGLVAHWAPGLPSRGFDRYPIASLWMFLAYALVAAPFSQFSALIAYTQLFEVFKTILFSTLLLWAIRNEEHLRVFMNAIVLGVLHASTLHVLGPKFGYISMARGREYGVLPDTQAGTMVIFIPLLLVIAATGKSKTERILAFITLGMSVDSLVNTYERTGFVSLSVEICLFLLLNRKVVMRFLPLGLVLGTIMLLRFTPDNYWHWISTIQKPTEEGSANSRLVVNKASARMFMDHPLGVGYRNYPFIAQQYLPVQMLTVGNTRAAHNIYFSILCETGVIGFIAWMGAFIGATRLLRRLRKVREGGGMIPMYALGLEIGIYGWFVDGCFMGDHELDPAYWFVALAIIMTRLYALRLEKERLEPAAGSSVARPLAAVATNGGRIRPRTVITGGISNAVDRTRPGAQ